MSRMREYQKHTAIMAVLFVMMMTAIIGITYKSDNTDFAGEDYIRYEGWYQKEAGSRQPVNGRSSVDSGEEGFSIYNILPKAGREQFLLFKTSCQDVTVYAGDQPVCQSAGEGRPFWGKSAGSGYHIVRFDEKDGGKEIAIEYTFNYKRKNSHIYEFYLGSEGALIKMLFIKHLPAFLTNCLIFLIGLVFFGAGIIFRKTLKTKQSVYLGIFALLFSCWSLLQSGFIQLFIKDYSQAAAAGSLLFLFMPPTLLLFAGELYKLYDNSIRPAGRVCLVLAVSAAVDLHRVYSYAMWDVTKCTRISLLVLMTGALFYYIRLYMETSSSLTEARLLAGLAYQDVMTGLYNRTAYAEDTAIYEKQLIGAPEKLNLIYVIFDLNNLKEMNDSHGHGAGDHYIALTGKIIKKAFDRYGKCYRIGGDEFAVIMKDKKTADYEFAVRELERLIRKENETADVEYSLAFGHARFIPGEYASMAELTAMADKNMYENKTSYKEAMIADAAI